MRHIILALNTRDRLTDINILNTNGFQVKPLVGQYQHDNGQVVNENSYLIKIDSENRLRDLKRIAKFHGQESILVLDQYQNVTLDYLQEAKTIDLGVFTNCTKSEALASTAYTYDQETKEYYICIAA